MTSSDNKRENRKSLVAFLRSIKFHRRGEEGDTGIVTEGRFAKLTSPVDSRYRKRLVEERQLVRSAN